MAQLHAASQSILVHILPNTYVIMTYVIRLTFTYYSDIILLYFQLPTSIILKIMLAQYVKV